MYFQLPTVNTRKIHDVHYKKVHETTAPWIFVKATKHKIAMPARTVSGPAGCFCTIWQQSQPAPVKRLLFRCSKSNPIPKMRSLIMDALLCWRFQAFFWLAVRNGMAGKNHWLHREISNLDVEFWEWNVHNLAHRNVWIELGQHEMFCWFVIACFF